MSSKLYKGHYAIAFYNKDNDTLIDIVDNPKQLCERRGIEPTRKNVIAIYKSLSVALADGSMTEVYDGKTKLHVHLIDIYDDEEDE